MRRILSLVYIGFAQTSSDIFKAAEIEVVARRLAGEIAMQRVVKIILPVCVQAVAAARLREHQLRIVKIALRDQHELTARVCPSRFTSSASSASSGCASKLKMACTASRRNPSKP